MQPLLLLVCLCPLSLQVLATVSVCVRVCVLSHLCVCSLRSPIALLLSLCQSRQVTVILLCVWLLRFIVGVCCFVSPRRTGLVCFLVEVQLVVSILFVVSLLFVSAILYFLPWHIR